MASPKQFLRKALKRLSPRRKGPAILAYHRVARPRVDPWGLAIAPEVFRSQMEAIAQSGRALPLDQFVVRLRAGTLPPDAIAITFDDGYSDNADLAVPMLTRANVPASFFVVTGAIGKQREFWWDELARLVLLSPEVKSCDADLPGGRLHLELDPLPAAEQLATWRVWDERPSRRLQTYRKAWSHLHRLSPAGIRQAMAVFAALLTDAPSADPADFAMSLEAARAIGGNARFMLGPHTVNHPDLTMLGDGDAEHEIAGSIAWCAELTGTAPAGFTYPFGARDRRLDRFVEAGNCLFACSTRNTPVERNADPYDLPRRPPTTRQGADFLRRLQ